jgi:hypothetical protein
MEWALAKRYLMDVVKRLSGGDQARQLEADALEHVLAVGQETRMAREVAEGLRLRLNRLSQALQEAELVGCECDGAIACGIHRLVKVALDADGVTP